MSDWIDMFCHLLPRTYVERVHALGCDRSYMFRRAAANPMLTDPTRRYSILERHPGYRQVISLVSPPLEAMTEAAQARELARVANDELAAGVARHPELLLGFVAAVALNDMDAGLAEAERAVLQLGACGVQIFTPAAGKPLDDPAFRPLFRLMAELDRPIWLHPHREQSVPDYSGEDISRHEIWWSLGWPYETTLAIIRLACAGIFREFPELKIIAHHAGGLIPMIAGRLGTAGMPRAGMRTPEEYGWAVETPLETPPADDIRRFVADTATFGSAAALACAHDFFGNEQMVFATDMPFGCADGLSIINETIGCIHSLGLNARQKERIGSGNALELLPDQLKTRGKSRPNAS